MNLTAKRERALAHAFRFAPVSLYSAAVGWGARRTMPRALRAPLYRTFARVVGARLEETELPLAEYPSFGEFFARRLRAGARSVDAAARDAIISPCDGAVVASGTATRGRMLQAKGVDFALADLVGDRALADTLTGGDYLTIYLSPRDYHRVHSPIAGELVGYDYIPGQLFPVKPSFIRTIPGLWAINERVVLRLRGEAGEVAVIMVGAVGVSNIRITNESMETRHLRPMRARRSVRLQRPVPLTRGAELGAFQVGSTVIALFQRGFARLDALELGRSVQLGQPVGTICAEVGTIHGTRGPAQSATSDKL